MAVIENSISPTSESYQANRAGMLAQIARVNAVVGRTVAASELSKKRFHERGQLLPRERIALLLDAGAPFLELSALAGYCLDTPDPEKSIPGRRHDRGHRLRVRRALHGHRERLGHRGRRAAADGSRQARCASQEIALENKLPFVQLVESAGANLLRYRVEDFIRGGTDVPQSCALLSAAGLPVVTVTHGSSTAGGAYQTGLSDYIILVRGRSRAFLAGPPLLKAATGEIATEEELGGAEMHTTVSGLGDYLAEDDRDAIGIAREIMGKLNGTAAFRPTGVRDVKPPRYDAEELLGIMPMDYKHPVDMKQVIARIVDDSDFLEFGANYGSVHRVRQCEDRRLRRSASSPTTARSTRPAPPRPRTSSRPAARRARRCST
jgi:geranyl-CoA carboxylase beta subunit